ncbi:MAG TPA: ABC transporter substrate-binding protein [Syntrophorhabdaceae bacterium]|nr:ABC transporter substrate-binding protein [Syntrophorhabdaceae bacterium]
MKRYFLLSLCLIGFLGLFFVCPASHAAGKTIKVGIVDSYSGPAAIFGIDMRDGFRLGVNEINAKGGVLGKKIEIVTRDEKFQPDVALAMAKELVMKENVDLLMGTISSASALAISDFAKREKLPFLVTYAKSEKITGEKGHRYVFAFSENTAMAGRAAGAVLAKKPYTKYWIAGDDMEYGHAICESTWNTVKKLNPKAQLLGETWWKVGETDFVPYITQIMAAKPDYIIMGNSGASVIGFQKAAKATGLIDKVPIYQHTAIEFAVLTSLGLEGPENVAGTASYMFYYPQTPENKAFVAKYQKQYNRVPTMPSFYGYTAAQFISKAYEKAGAIDKEKFINALEGMTLDTSAIGKLQMRKCDHQLMLPVYYGMTKKVPEYKDFLIGTDIMTVPPGQGYPSCEEIEQLRAKAK